jgi:hypothetical protein
VTRDLKRAVTAARERLKASAYQDRDAWAALHQAERQLGAQRGEPWAEPLGLGVRWDLGAPLPHLVSNGSTAVLLCHASTVDPHWDGTYVSVVSPADHEPVSLLQFTFEGCHATKFGGPNDEVLSGHALYSRGLEGYQPHIVHNSPWIAEEERINSVHSYHRGGWHERMRHYFFVFHDEMFEALAREVRVESVHGILLDRLQQAARNVIQDQ